MFKKVNFIITTTHSHVGIDRKKLKAWVKQINEFFFHEERLKETISGATGRWCSFIYNTEISTSNRDKLIEILKNAPTGLQAIIVETQTSGEFMGLFTEFGGIENTI